MHKNQSKAPKKCAYTPPYVSPKQLTLEGFETPFKEKLHSDNRWVKLAKTIPWDAIVSRYNKIFQSRGGREPINGRVILGAIIIKHMDNLSDRETIEQIRENKHMQYFLGYSSYTDKAPFSQSLFVRIRERLTFEFLKQISELIAVDCIKDQPAKDENTNSSPRDDLKENNTDENEPKENISFGTKGNDCACSITTNIDRHENIS